MLAAPASVISPTAGRKARPLGVLRRTHRAPPRTDGFTHGPTSCAQPDPALESGCAFEELISFHGGIGGPQTRPFILHPAELATPDTEIIGAASVHEILLGWRHELNGPAAP
jgi:hypothetical protein